MRLRGAMIVTAVCLAAFGCASSYFDQYRDGHPEWAPAFPDTKANLEQTIASLYAPPPIGTQLTIRKLTILRADVEPWSEIAFADLRSGKFQSSASDRYVVVANFFCRSRVDLQSYVGEKVGFYLLPENRLAAYDHYDFVEGCTVYNAFRPATGELVQLERTVEAYIAKTHPASMIHVTELFRKGIAYAEVGRIDDAKRMLREGSVGLDVSGEKPEFGTPGVRIQVQDRGDAKRARVRLAEAIAAAEDD